MYQKNNISKFAGISLSIIIFSMLTGCNFFSNISPDKSNFTGIAFVNGVPIVDGTVGFTCYNNATGGPITVTTTTNIKGNYAINNVTRPCKATVTGGTIKGIPNTNEYSSITGSTQIVNITPLTDVIAEVVLLQALAVGQGSIDPLLIGEVTSFVQFFLPAFKAYPNPTSTLHTVKFVAEDERAFSEALAASGNTSGLIAAAINSPTDLASVILLHSFNSTLTTKCNAVGGC